MQTRCLDVYTDCSFGTRTRGAFASQKAAKSITTNSRPAVYKSRAPLYTAAAGRIFRSPRELFIGAVIYSIYWRVLTREYTRIYRAEGFMGIEDVECSSYFCCFRLFLTACGVRANVGEHF